MLIRASANGLAWGWPDFHHLFVRGPGQRPRALGSPKAHQVNLPSARRGAQLPRAQDQRRVSEHKRQIARPYYSSKKQDPTPKQSALLSRVRYRIVMFSWQLVGRYSIKRVWARDLWHLMSRLEARSFLTPWPFYSTTDSATSLFNS